MAYAQLNTTTSFTFLTGASHPHEYMYRAAELGYDALAITDECSLAGVVKAFVASEELNFKLIIGSRFTLSNGLQLIAIAPSKKAYAELSGFITLARRRSPKGEYEAHFEDLRFRLQNCLIIWLGQTHGVNVAPEAIADELNNAFKGRLWIGINHQLHGGEQKRFRRWLLLSRTKNIPMVACGEALMHCKSRKPLQDVLTAIRENTSVLELGGKVILNAEAYLKSEEQLRLLYPDALLEESSVIADLCNFSMTELRYEYPRELVPENLRPIDYLRSLVDAGKSKRWPTGVPSSVQEIIEKELELVEELAYEYYFLTVHDIVQYARKNNILCQGRGSAANSVICYCLFVTEIAPGQINVLFERFISRERDEPPDIDVDFEHQRREEVIQYIYRKYGRERAAIAATVITYRPKSAVRDVGKALGMELSLLSFISKNIAWWDSTTDINKRIQELGLRGNQKLLTHFFTLLHQILGFPRHLSQHVGGFIIAQDQVTNLVPIENASMPDRTIIQWDKEDLESMKLLKIDVLSLGMLSAIRRTLELVNTYNPQIKSLADIPLEDPATYEMLCNGDSVGVFQVESRAQVAMLPRLQPRCFYDLVIEIALVRPGPIQGDMVHPFLRRRSGLEAITYPSDTIKEVLSSTLGVPIFQEQVMRLAMVAAGFTGGKADQLRRAMTNWGKNSKLLLFQEDFINGLLGNGYSQEYAERMFEQVKGFGGYGFPESHSASFALICYASSWLKCHHPAAFCCGLLNSLPMGFYSASQLIQDVRRHGVIVLPVDINKSFYDNTLERISDRKNKFVIAIRLGFREINGINTQTAQSIELSRGLIPFASIEELSRRCALTSIELQELASASALEPISGNRHKARWEAAAVAEYSELLSPADNRSDDLFTNDPTLAKNIFDDFKALGHSLRAHPLTLLRDIKPFNRCTKNSDLIKLRNKQFVRIAGLVTCRQRPGTASGAMFLTLEDETGDINVIVWKDTQETFRKVILTGKLLVIKGIIEIVTDHVKRPVLHVIAGHLADHSKELSELAIKSRNFH